MSYAKFTTHSEAQAYADAVQAELSKNPAYIATGWATVQTGSDGYFYVDTHSIVTTSADIVSDVPQENNEE